MQQLTTQLQAMGGGAEAQAEMVEAAVQHFRHSSQLLLRHDISDVLPLATDVLDLRPLAGGVPFSAPTMARLTTGQLQQAHALPGSHWSMLFDDNAASVAAVVGPACVAAA